MHGWETRMLLKHCLERGVSQAELSRRFGVSRRTILYLRSFGVTRAIKKYLVWWHVRDWIRGATIYTTRIACEC